MRFWLGVLAGIGAAWAALAIWQRVPPLSEIVWEADDPNADLKRLALGGEPDNVHLRHRFPPPPVIDPAVHITLGVRP